MEDGLFWGPFLNEKVAENEDFNLHDFNDRLEWPTECRDKEKEKHTPNFVKSEWMNFLWNPISVLENIGSADKPNYEKTIRIGQASVHVNIFLSKDWGPKKETNLFKA